VPEYVLVSIDEYPHPSLFAGLYFTDSQLCGIAPRTKVHHLGPSMDRCIRIVQHFEWVLDLCHMLLKMKETSSFHYGVYVQKKNKTLFWGGGWQSVVAGGRGT